MRRRGPSKQRLRLGSRRYPCWGGRQYTDADAYCYSDRDRHANGNSIGNKHTPPNANTQIGAVTKIASHAFAEALDLTTPKISGDGGPGIASSC
jgi:hypothetical protein